MDTRNWNSSRGWTYHKNPFLGSSIRPPMYYTGFLWPPAFPPVPRFSSSLARFLFLAPYCLSGTKYPFSVKAWSKKMLVPFGSAAENVRDMTYLATWVIWKARGEAFQLANALEAIGSIPEGTSCRYNQVVGGSEGFFHGVVGHHDSIDELDLAFLFSLALSLLT